jgi:hypothetical protein
MPPQGFIWGISRLISATQTHKYPAEQRWPGLDLHVPSPLLTRDMSNPYATSETPADLWLERSLYAGNAMGCMAYGEGHVSS